MQRVDKQVGATERNPGRDAAVAEPEKMSVSGVPARPAWVSHADNSPKSFSFMSRLYRRPHAGSRQHVPDSSVRRNFGMRPTPRGFPGAARQRCAADPGSLRTSCHCEGPGLRCTANALHGVGTPIVVTPLGPFATLRLCLADRQNVGGRLPDLLIGQHLTPRRHADAVLLPPIGDRNKHALGVEHAPGEIDAAGAVLAVAMRALLLQEKGMTGRRSFSGP